MVVAPTQLRVSCIVVGFLETNCYLAVDPISGDALVIDPGDDAELILEAIRRESLVVRGIVNTHGHVDHIGANGILREELGCSLMIHELDAAYLLTSSAADGHALAGFQSSLSPPADRLLAEGDEIVEGSIILRVIHTPGHTPGSICLAADGLLFSGDTLFAGGVGRVDLLGGSAGDLLTSIREKLLGLPDEMIVYPGHGPSTTIGEERVHNPWLQERDTWRQA